MIVGISVQDITPVGTIPTILAQGEPEFPNFVNSVSQNGELSSRELCRLVPQEQLKFSAVTCSIESPMTRTITASPTMMMQHQAGSMKQTHIGGKQASSLDQSSLITSSSCLAFDELNTPEIGPTEFKFTDSHAYDTPPALLEDQPPQTWEGGIPFNTNEEQPLPVVLGWNTTPLVPQRPTELKLLIKLDHQEQQYKSVAARPTELKLKMSETPLPVLETPMVMDTPEVFHQFGDTNSFDLINFVLNDKSSGSPLESTNKYNAVPLASILPAVKQEPPTYYEELSPAQYVISSTTEVEDKFVPPSEIPSTSQEVIVTSSPQVRKRRSSRRQSSLEQCNYEQSDDEDYSNSSSYGSKRFKSSGSIKEEFEDGSSIAGSAAESKYNDMRVRNNEASRRSRQNRKQRETHMEREANGLQATNVRLRTHVDKLEHLVLTMRKALLDSVNKANKK
ncbi:hypothetical protein B566_EDAN016968 [Ephemera danica]|nr:hypothetical protein B566_EDAN016968 [Ephemera danica]